MSVVTVEALALGATLLFLSLPLSVPLAFSPSLLDASFNTNNKSTNVHTVNCIYVRSSDCTVCVSFSYSLRALVLPSVRWMHLSLPVDPSARYLQCAALSIKSTFAADDRRAKVEETHNGQRVSLD